jgi:hypothetical protein
MQYTGTTNYILNVESYDGKVKKYKLPITLRDRIFLTSETVNFGKELQELIDKE